MSLAEYGLSSLTNQLPVQDQTEDTQHFVVMGSRFWISPIGAGPCMGLTLNTGQMVQSRVAANFVKENRTESGTFTMPMVLR